MRGQSDKLSETEAIISFNRFMLAEICNDLEQLAALQQKAGAE